VPGYLMMALMTAMTHPSGWPLSKPFDSHMLLERKVADCQELVAQCTQRAVGTMAKGSPKAGLECKYCYVTLTK